MGCYLKASHRELDEEHTTEGDPYHPHTRAVPVEPGTIEVMVGSASDDVRLSGAFEITGPGVRLERRGRFTTPVRVEGVP